MCMPIANLSQFALFRTTKISHSVLTEIKISCFFACYALISHEYESYSKKPEIIIVLL